MKITTNVKGQLAISKAELRALELGYIPSRPIFDTRYDLILDDRKSLKRIQVKYANGTPSHSRGSVVVKLSYEDRNKRKFMYQQEEVDGLIVYLPKIDKLCYFPLEIFVNKGNLAVRIQKPLNNRKKGIIFAEDYYW
ncbi:hypothetical protein A2630_00115 [Candidatus Woesebacteria bacterium RIFCSPHIGHO2_01_FULL_44_10]|uniref:PD(D/E)XK endonuclease domain-containing protein n=1 Tax=Candidatus Woesebacteria bacterium RIFCSPLOWO2_01_FULL_44_14 TaxID=1802525 RepID=A0A1F8BYQ8_9BACT|nr:MAG: hypothetical protein A2630_00115 [Candidatus Woesebacteria bacterium RIFCSPHIGHO2_01_FULL_44_10]OGM56273.1 MAG: hypothetical protein A3F62_03435 [Candidatus Woesebacteria bacterium RIFCSPHIGHO2_12_FULL_44_11]OGM68709.1 MAG: hypothetical protein A2975_05415 [Candidatus Woesebacteria bacterium RIFCSPLOWO2_01_FULL_44_14]